MIRVLVPVGVVAAIVGLVWLMVVDEQRREARRAEQMQVFSAACSETVRLAESDVARAAAQLRCVEGAQRMREAWADEDGQRAIANAVAMSGGAVAGSAASRR